MARSGTASIDVPRMTTETLLRGDRPVKARALESRRPCDDRTAACRAVRSTVRLIGAVGLVFWLRRPGSACTAEATASRPAGPDRRGASPRGSWTWADTEAARERHAAARDREPDGRVPDPARARSRRSTRSISRSIRARSWRSSASSARARACRMLAVMGLLPWTARVSADRLAFDGQRPAAPVARRAPPDPRQGHGDDLPGADDLLEPLLHGRLPADRGDPGARGRIAPAGARAGDRAARPGRHPLARARACAPSRTSSRAA